MPEGDTGAKVQHAAVSLCCSHVTKYLEIGERCPLQLLRTLRVLNESHKAGFPDFQDKKRGGDMLWRDHKGGVRGCPDPGSLPQALGADWVSDYTAGFQRQCSEPGS